MVAGCIAQGVRPCWPLNWREGEFPTLFLTMRTPMTAGESPTEILAAAVEFLSTSSVRPLQHVCAFLIERGKAGVCARFAPGGAFWTVVPVMTTFEALPLDEFDELADAVLFVDHEVPGMQLQGVDGVAPLGRHAPHVLRGRS